MGTEPKEKVGRSLPTTVAGRLLMKKSAPTRVGHNQPQRSRPELGYQLPDVVSVSYQSAMLRRTADADLVPVRRFSAPDIPSEVLEAIRAERGETLGGTHGDPSWGEPIQFDRVVIEQPQRITDIRVYNRAIQLFTKDSEMIRRIHRLCETVRKACEGPG
jgi:hypothetical protein